jgi:FMN-dependent NADH-azoreductase
MSGRAGRRSVVHARWRRDSDGAYEQVVEGGSLFGTERSEQLVFDAAESLLGEAEFALPHRGELDDVAAAVSGVAAARDQPTLFEFVQEADDVARVEMKRLRQALLARRSLLVKQPQRDQVAGPKPTRCHRDLSRPAADSSQVIEQRQQLALHVRPGRGHASKRTRTHRPFVLHKCFVVHTLSMSHLLHLDSSLRVEGSRSRALSAHFARRWQAQNPGGVVTYRDLAADPIPHLDHVAFSSAFVAPVDRTPAQVAARAFGDELIEELLAADTVLIGLPLYNFGPPSTFKAWFDRIVVPERTIGKLGDKKFVIVTARGGGYGPGTPREGWDHREPWLRHALRHLGVEDPLFVDTELTLARESPAMIPLDLGRAEDKSLADALAAIDALFAA